MEDSKILSLSCWNREQAIYQMNLLILDIQKSLYCKNQITIKVDEFFQIILDVGTKEISRQEIETRTINRYLFIKVGTTIQKQIMFSVLDQVFNNYRKLIFLYQTKLTNEELAILKSDLNRFKIQLRQQIYIRGATISEILTIITQCSKGRLDRALEIANNNAITWRELFFKQAEIKRIKIKNSRHLILDDDQSPSTPRQAVLCLSGYKIKKMSIHSLKKPINNQMESISQSRTDRYPELKSNFDRSTTEQQSQQDRSPEQKSQLNRSPEQKSQLDRSPEYKSRFDGSPDQKSDFDRSLEQKSQLVRSPKHRSKLNGLVFKSSQSFESKRNSLFKTLKLPQKDQSSMQSSYRQLQNNDSIISTTQIDQYSKYTMNISPKYILPVYLESYKSEQDTYISDNYYKDVQNDSTRSSQNDSSIHINREYKELCRGNQGISQGIENFRRTFLIFLNKQKAQQKKFTTRLNNTWNLRIEQPNISSKLLPIFDVKYISQILNSRKYYHQIDVKNQRRELLT